MSVECCELNALNDATEEVQSGGGKIKRAWRQINLISLQQGNVYQGYNTKY